MSLTGNSLTGNKRSYGTSKADGYDRGYLAEQGACIANANSFSHKEHRAKTPAGESYGKWTVADEVSYVDDLMISFRKVDATTWYQKQSGGYMDAQSSLSGVKIFPSTTREQLERNVSFAGIQVGNHKDNQTQFNRNKIALFVRGLRTIKNVMNSREVDPGDLLRIRLPEVHDADKRKAEYLSVNFELSKKVDTIVPLIEKVEHAALFDELKTSFVKHYIDFRAGLQGTGPAPVPNDIEKLRLYNQNSLVHLNPLAKVAPEQKFASSTAQIAASLRLFILWTSYCAIESARVGAGAGGGLNVVSAANILTELGQFFEPTQTTPPAYPGRFVCTDALFRLVLGETAVSTAFDAVRAAGTSNSWVGIHTGAGGLPTPAVGGGQGAAANGATLLKSAFPACIAGIGMAINDSRALVIGKAVSYGDGQGKIDILLN